jgi:hypothetical protein
MADVRGRKKLASRSCAQAARDTRYIYWPGREYREYMKEARRRRTLGTGVAKWDSCRVLMCDSFAAARAGTHTEDVPTGAA